MPTFERNATVTIYYESTGQGRPVLLLHGFMGTGRTEFPTLVEWLTQRYQVITPDLRGYGQSIPKPRAYPVDFYRQDAEDMAALVDHLHLSEVLVLGYSDGGEVALWLPILLPAKISGVVTWGATGHFDTSIRPAIMEMLGMGWLTPHMGELHGAEHLPIMVQQWVMAMVGMIDAGGDITYTRAHAIQCPVLMLLGDRDWLNPVPMGRAMAKAIPKGRFTRYPRTGHAIHEERPRLFRWQVGRFLKGIR